MKIKIDDVEYEILSFKGEHRKIVIETVDPLLLKKAEEHTLNFDFKTNKMSLSFSDDRFIFLGYGVMFILLKDDKEIELLADNIKVEIL